MTFFIDLDGTIVRHGTNQLLPGAKEMLDALKRAGGQLVFVTRRSNSEFGEKSVYSGFSAIDLLDSIGYGNCILLSGYGSPRVLIDDSTIRAVHHQNNAPWTETDIAGVLDQTPTLPPTPSADLTPSTTPQTPPSPHSEPCSSQTSA